MPPRWRTRTRWPREAVARPRRVAPGFPYPEPGAAVAAPGFNVEIKIATLPPSTRRQRGGRASTLHAVQPSAPAGAGRISIAPRRNGRKRGRLRRSLLRQVARKRAVLDAGGSDQPRHEGRATNTPPGHAYGASTPRLKHVAACGDKGRSRFVVEGWPCQRQGAGRCSRHAGMPSRPSLHSGQGGPCVLVSL